MIQTRVLTTLDQHIAAALWFAMSRPMDWDLCIVCQTVSLEKLRCPAKSASDQTPADVYSAFLENVEKFKDLNALPVDVDYGEHGQFKHLCNTMHHGTNNAFKSIITPYWSVPDRGKYERENVQKERLLTDLSVSPI